MEREAVEFYLDPPDTSTAFAWFAISPDGRRLVADMMTGDGHALYQRTLDARDWRAIPGTEGAGNPTFPIGKRPVFPFFSPDGRWVGYGSRDGTLKRIPVDGGTAQTITPIPRGFWGASWAADNTIVFSASPSGTESATLFRVPASGGVPERLTVLDSVTGNHLFPCLSRDGAVLFFENAFPRTLMALSLGSGRVARLGTGISPLAARDGQLVYATPDGVIFSRTFNPRTLAFEGAPRRVVEGAGVIVVMASYAVSPGGTLVYETGSVGSRLVLVDREGGTRAFGESFPVRHPRFSPSGDRVAFIGREGGLSERGGGDVWVYSFASGTAQLLSHEGPAVDPAWSSDGRYVGYSAPGNGQGRWKLFRRLADGTGSAQLLVSGKTDLYQMAFAPGDQEIVFYSGTDLFRFRIGRDSQPVPLFQTTATEQQPTIAPDGHWLAYTSNETGTDEIYVRSYPDMGARTVVSIGGGSDPTWSANGSNLFYWGHGHQIVAALRRAGGRLDVVSRTELFPTAPFQPAINRNYDVRPDGRDFVMVRGGASRAVVRVGALNGAPQ